MFSKWLASVGFLRTSVLLCWCFCFCFCLFSNSCWKGTCMCLSSHLTSRREHTAGDFSSWQVPPHLSRMAGNHLPLYLSPWEAISWERTKDISLSCNLLFSFVRSQWSTCLIYPHKRFKTLAGFPPRSVSMFQSTAVQALGDSGARMWVRSSREKTQRLPCSTLLWASFSPTAVWEYSKSMCMLIRL